MILCKILDDIVENDYIDFKRQWYSQDKLGTVSLIHDILSMSNSLTDSINRYIIIGVDEDKNTKQKTIVDVSNDDNCRKSANIIQTLRNYMSIVPLIEVHRDNINGQFIDIIKITPTARNLPYILNKPCQAQNADGKKITVRKEWIYSRNSDRNTPIDECCTKAELEEIFARKRGEHLSVLERFSMYLDDVENWYYPNSDENYNVSENAYYYKKNHKFKIVKNDKNSAIEKLNNAYSYDDIISSTYLSENYWNYLLDSGSCYDDSYEYFYIEIWADNTLIDVFEITSVFLKYFKNSHYCRNFYIPRRKDILKGVKQIYSRDDIQKSLAWKICNLIYKFDKNIIYANEDTPSTDILDILNYEYLVNPDKYRNKNDWMYKAKAKKIIEIKIQ